jgi:hypothetical protein
MQMWRLLADFWTAIEKGLHHISTSKRIKEPTITFSNLSNPKQESPTDGLSGTKLDQMD